MYSLVCTIYLVQTRVLFLILKDKKKLMLKSVFYAYYWESFIQENISCELLSLVAGEVRR